MDKQQGPTVQHRELYSISCNKPQWKRIYIYIYKYKYIYVYIYIYIYIYNFAVHEKLTHYFNKK